MKDSGNTPRVLICGSRNWTDHAAINARIANLDASCTVIHGGAPGADSAAAEAAYTRGMNVKAYPADWTTHGRSAGILRNLQMLDQQPDLVIAFRCTGGSRGTDHTISEARRRGIPVEVIEA